MHDERMLPELFKLKTCVMTQLYLLGIYLIAGELVGCPIASRRSTNEAMKAHPMFTNLEDVEWMAKVLTRFQ